MVFMSHVGHVLSNKKLAFRKKNSFPFLKYPSAFESMAHFHAPTVAPRSMPSFTGPSEADIFVYFIARCSAGCLYIRRNNFPSIDESILELKSICSVFGLCCPSRNTAEQEVPVTTQRAMKLFAYIFDVLKDSLVQSSFSLWIKHQSIDTAG